jgi:hypothetical protein
MKNPLQESYQFGDEQESQLVISGSAGQHYSLNALPGALSGFCEGWVFFRKR